MISNRVNFLDTTLRDGEQSLGCSMNRHEKLQRPDIGGVDPVVAGTSRFGLVTNTQTCTIREVVKGGQRRSIPEPPGFRLLAKRLRTLCRCFRGSTPGFERGRACPSHIPANVGSACNRPRSTEQR